MAKLNGTWRFVSQNNIDGYHTAKKTPEAFREYFRSVLAAANTNPDFYKEQLTIDVADGTANRTAFVNGERKRDTRLKIGVESDVTLADGRAAKNRIEVQSDSKATIHDRGDGFESAVVYEVSGNELVVTHDSAGQTSVWKFVKV